MMTQGIKQKDIEDFEKCVRKLNSIVERIQEYKSEAGIYVTPNFLNLMSNRDFDIDKPQEGQKLIVAQEHVTSLDCGDW